MAIVSNLALVDTLRETHLLSAEQLAKLLRRLPNRLIDARTVSRYILQKEWLTVYQVSQLLAGRGRELVHGSYEVLDLLGQGGQSTVYKARHRESGLIVALKVAKTHQLASQAAADQFMAEMEAMASLDHPSIVQFIDADHDDLTCFCAMEYVAGTDLGKYVRLIGPLPAVEACEYVRQTALGLQHAHERNLIHRDIKPVNLCLTGERRETGLGMTVKILDWGLANLCPPKTGAEEAATGGNKILLGTADYLAPEQAMDPDAADIRSDIYSLGCTFYYFLAAHPPFPTGKVMEKILAHQTQEPTPIGTIRPDLPLGLDAIVKRMLSKKPAERYQTPAAVALALKPFCRPDRFMLPRLNRQVRERLGLENSSSGLSNTPLPHVLGADSDSHATAGLHIKDAQHS